MSQSISNTVAPGTKRVPIGGEMTPPVAPVQGNVMPPPMPLTPPSGVNIKSHQIKHPDGTMVTQTFHPPVQGAVKAPGQKQEEEKMPEIKVINGTHHVPMKKPDGSWGFINAKGEMS